MAPIRPEVAVSDNANALKKRKLVVKISFAYNYRRYVGNKSTTTQKSTASDMLVRASKIELKAKVWFALCTQFSAKVDTPDTKSVDTKKKRWIVVKKNQYSR